MITPATTAEQAALVSHAIPDVRFRVGFVLTDAPLTKRRLLQKALPAGGFKLPADDPDHAAGVIAKAAAVFEANNCPWMIGDGTLLGAMRNDGFIPGDNDVDLKIPLKHINKPLIDALVAAGFTLHRTAHFSERLTNFGVHFEGICIDINGIKIAQQQFTSKSVFWVPGSGLSQGYLTYRLPWTGIESFQLAGRTLKRPKNPEAYLVCAYGKDWRRPVSSWDHHFSYLALHEVIGNAKSLEYALQALQIARAPKAENV